MKAEEEGMGLEKYRVLSGNYLSSIGPRPKAQIKKTPNETPGLRIADMIKRMTS